MGRLCIVHQNIENSFASHVSTANWSIGFLIGCHTEQKDYVVHFAVTPLEEEDSQKGLNNLKDHLLTTHATELQRLLSGGLSICGLVVAASGAELSSNQVKFQTFMTAVYKKLSKLDLHSSSSDQWTLITMDRLTKKFSAKSLLVTDYKSTFKPAELRFQSLNSGWLIAKTSLPINRTFYLRRHQQDQHFEEQLLTIENSVCLLNGDLLSEDAVLGSAEHQKGKKSNSETSAQLVTVRLLAKSSLANGSACEEMVSSIWLKGTISAVAFLRAPATAAQLEEALKNDLKKSITVRCQLLCEDILQVGSEKHTTEDELIYETPPRVYIPLPNTPIIFNDYMFKDEKTEDCAERAQQLLGVEVDSEQIDTSVERSANTDDIEEIEQSRQDVQESADSTEEQPKPNLAGNIGRVASIVSGAVLVLAASLSYMNFDQWFG